MSDEGKSRHMALCNFAFRRTVPLLGLNDKGEPECGTGTFFEVAGRQFVITAQHVADLREIQMIMWGELEVKVPLAGCLLRKPKDRKEIDVAAFELTQAHVEKVKSHDYAFVGPEMVDLQGPANPATIIGFPAHKYRDPEDGVVRPIAFQTAQCGTPNYVNREHIEGVDFYYEYPREMYRVGDGELVNSPELFGVSGASVWMLIQIPDALWSANKSAKISAIQIAYVKEKHTRVQSWWMVARLLSLYYPSIADELASVTGFPVEAFLMGGREA